MVIQVRARYANGVLTPFEPLDLEEGAVVELCLEGTVVSGHGSVGGELKVTPGTEEEAAKTEYRVVPFHSEFVPGVDPKKLKQFLNDEDDELFLKSLNKTE